MKNTGIITIIALILCAIVNLAPLLLPEAEGLEILLSVCAFSALSVAGAYVGLDLLAIVKGTKRADSGGSFVKADIKKYIAIMVTLALLTIEVLIISIIIGLPLFYVAFYFGACMAICTFYIAGIKAKKAAYLAKGGTC